MNNVHRALMVDSKNETLEVTNNMARPGQNHMKNANISVVAFLSGETNN